MDLYCICFRILFLYKLIAWVTCGERTDVSVCTGETYSWAMYNLVRNVSIFTYYAMVTERLNVSVVQGLVIRE